MLMIVNRYFNNLVYLVYPQLKYTIVSELFQECKVKTCLIPVMSLRVVWGCYGVAAISKVSQFNLQACLRFLRAVI